MTHFWGIFTAPAVAVSEMADACLCANGWCFCVRAFRRIWLTSCLFLKKRRAPAVDLLARCEWRFQCLYLCYDSIWRSDSNSDSDSDSSDSDSRTRTQTQTWSQIQIQPRPSGIGLTLRLVSFWLQGTLWQLKFFIKYATTVSSVLLTNYQHLEWKK